MENVQLGGEKEVKFNSRSRSHSSKNTGVVVESGPCLVNKEFTVFCVAIKASIKPLRAVTNLVKAPGTSSEGQDQQLISQTCCLRILRISTDFRGRDLTHSTAELNCSTGFSVVTS